MYSQFQNNFQNQAGASGNVVSQYRGYETKYQPVGYVQSQYNSSIQSGMNNSMNQQPYTASYSQMQSPQPYHTASYRGNQQGHDAYLRADSTQPSQSQYGMGMSSYSSSPYAMSSFNAGAVQANQPYNQFQNAQSFHTANYRGDQPGHDAYLRSDSTQTAQSQSGIGASSYSGSPYPSSFANMGMNNIQQQAGSSYSQFQNQNQNPQSYHTASYRGNQQGHDAYLRSDSTQTAQSQYGMGASTFNKYQF